MPSDAQLRSWIAGMRAGEEQAFEAFVERFWGPIALVVAKFNPRPCDREEWTDLILLHAADQIVKGKLEFLSATSLGAWLHRLAVRKCIEQWRRQKRSRELPTEVNQLAATPDPAAQPPPRSLELAELRRIVLESVERIRKPNLRETLQMVWRDGYTVEETALKLGRPIDTIRTWERRGKLALREILEREHPDLVEAYSKAPQKRATDPTKI
ncbi:MAG: RNA polymerase sigma factor [Planctomycetota bacterium]